MLKAVAAACSPEDQTKAEEPKALEEAKPEEAKPVEAEPVAAEPVEAKPEEEKDEPKPLAIMSAHAVKPLTMGQMMAQFDDSFKNWDKDHDGQISLKELNEALAGLKIEVTQDDLDKIDNDHDGGLNMVEFREAFYTMVLRHGDMDQNQLLIKTFDFLKTGVDKDAMKMRQETNDERKDRFKKANILKAELRKMYTDMGEGKKDDVDMKDLKTVLGNMNMKWENKKIDTLLEGMKADFGETHWDDFEAVCYTAMMKTPDAKLHEIISNSLNRVYNVEIELKKDEEKEA